MEKTSCPKNIANEPCHTPAIDQNNVPDGVYYTTNITVQDNQITNIESQYNPSEPALNIGNVYSDSVVNIMAKGCGDNSIALGAESLSGNSSVALGFNSEGNTQSVGIGYQSKCSGVKGISLGYNNVNIATESVSIGGNTQCSANYQVALGNDIRCTGGNTICIGRESNVSALTPKTGQIVIGGNASVGISAANINPNNVVIGHNSSSQRGGLDGSSEPNTVIGGNSYADGGSVTLLGQNNRADGSCNGCIYIGQSIVGNTSGELRIGGTSQISRAYIDSLGSNTGGHPVYYDPSTKELYYNTSP